MKSLRIVHNDLDGLVPCVLDKVHNLNFDDILSIGYEFWDDPETLNYIKTFGRVIISDLSTSEEFFHELIDLGVYVEIYDHHTSSNWMVDLPESDKYKVVHDETRSGTKIYFEESILKQFPRVKKAEKYMVELTDTYDLWKKESPLWEEAQSFTRVFFGMNDWDATGYVAKEKFVDQQVKKIRRLPEWRWLAGEQKIIDMAIEKERIALEDAEARLQTRVDSKGKTFATFHLGGKISITATKILEVHPELDYLIIQNSFRGLNSKLSFRSRTEEEFNCLDICLANGHTCAAGGSLKNTTDAQRFLEGDIYAIKYADEIEKEDDSPYHLL